eukprot:1151862-Pelagomonas_calceolata.AAC.5
MPGICKPSLFPLPVSAILPAHAVDKFYQQLGETKGKKVDECIKGEVSSAYVIFLFCSCQDTIYVAGRMIIKALRKNPWGAGLVNMDIGSNDRLAQHNLQIPAHASNRIIPPYLFPRNFPQRSRLTSSRPDAILITPYQAKPTSFSPASSSSHYALRSRHPTQRIS